MSGYKTNVSDETLQDLHNRLQHARWPDQVTENSDWSWGTPSSPLQKLVTVWREDYDWRATEQRLNAYQQDVVEVDEISIHYFRVGNPNGTPLVLLHGWPDSPLRFEQALPYLQDDFDLIIPSIPGYGFSSRPPTPGFGANKVAELFYDLTQQLGIAKFGLHGGDIGSAIAEAMALRYPDAVLGLHLLDVPFWHRYTVDPNELTEYEQAYSQAMANWFEHHGAYAALHRTKPQTLAYALNDSPIGLAAWMLEKYQAWSDCDGDVWSVFTPTELLDNIMLYWVTETAGSSVRYYRDSALEAKDATARVTVPTGFSIFPKDIPPAPHEFAKRFFNVVSWQQMPRGGHFGPMEQPADFSAALQGFFREL